MKRYIQVLLLIVAVGSSGVSHGKTNPEKFVHDFYVWYMKEFFIEQKNPVLNDKIYTYISKCTVERCRIAFDRQEWDSDYFVSAQDYDEEWIKNIKAYDAIPINASTLIVPVDISGAEASYPGLLVFLKQDRDTFRIIKVEKLRHWSE
jgi:hypothetical protein